MQESDSQVGPRKARPPVVLKVIIIAGLAVVLFNLFTGAFEYAARAYEALRPYL